MIQSRCADSPLDQYIAETVYRPFTIWQPGHWMLRPDRSVWPTTRGATPTMFNRFAVMAAVCIAIPVGVAPLALADPVSDPAIVPVDATNPLPPEGDVPSGPAGVLDTPDGWKLTVTGSNETQLPVAPLTTAISSREYLVAGTFVGTVTGKGKTKLTGGTLEAGE